jgi:hypothetical protein
MRYAFLLSLLAASLAAQSLIDTDFSGAYQPPARGERVTGSLPRGWRDNSNFGRVWVNYAKMQEAGRGFLRVDITRVEDGWCQFLSPLPHFDQETYLRLTLALRNPEGLMITMGVRHSGTPYKFLWETTQTYSADWKDYTFYGRVSRTDFDTGWFIVIHGTGHVDISRLRLEKITLHDLKRTLAGKTAAPGSKNLVRISRFPLGLQSGWALDREHSDGDDVEIGPDGQMTGPSGAPALRIKSASTMHLYTAPFAVPDLLASYTASLYLRGSGKGKLVAVSGLRPLGQQNFALSGQDWQRVSVRFTPDLLGRAHGVRIEGSGEFWLDALQVEQGTEPTAYESQGACEVSLATDSPLRIQFDDEPAAVRYAITGRVQDAALHVKVVNVYGEEKEWSVANVKGGEGALKYDVFKGKPYGPFRIEAWVTDRTGRRISPYNELVVNRLRRPHYWMKDAPNSPFGTHTLSVTRHILMAKAAGVNWARMHDSGTYYIGWYHLERKRGEWTFHDEQLLRYRKYGMKILGAYSTAPEWASYFPGKRHEDYSDRFFQPRNMDDFANYVRVVTQRYKGVIDTWDLWNEPYAPRYWGGGYDETRHAYTPSAHPPADFVQLMKTAYTTAKSVDPRVTVLGVQTSAGLEGEKWTAGIAAAGGKEYCDVMCYHQYTRDAFGYPGDGAEMGLRSALGPFLDKNARPLKPAWMTEGSSVDARTGNGIYHYTLPYEENEDVMETSDRLCRFVISLLAQGVKKVFLYSMHSNNWFGIGSVNRVLVTEDGYLHPSGAAHSAMAWFLEDTKFVTASTPAEGVTAYRFQGAGRTVTVLSPKPKHAPYAIPAHGYDLFGNPVPTGQALGRRLVSVVQ